jgi:tetratricopeptide (TPR) repeat protein
MNHKMKIISFVFLASLVGACKTHAPHDVSGNATETMLNDAKDLMENGEYYKARKLASSVLNADPQNFQAQGLVGEIMNLEIAKEKAVFAHTPVEEMTRDESRDQADVWFERSQTFLSLGEYQQAIDAAETIFLFEPESVRASQQLDRIRKKAEEAEKQGKHVWTAVNQDEINFRVENYRKSARSNFAKGQLGAAQFSVDKILILMPEDGEALQIKREIEKRKAA